MGIHHGLGSGTADPPLRGGLTVITLKHGNPGHHKGKHDAFDDPVNYVTTEGYAVLHVGPVGAVVYLNGDNCTINYKSLFDGLKKCSGWGIKRLHYL